MAEIVITEFMDEAGVESLRGFDVHYDPQLFAQADRLDALLRDCRGLIVRNRTQVRQRLLDAAPRLEVVGRLGVGLDNIDLAACGARRLPVLPASGTNDDTVAEYVIGALLQMLRPRTFRATEAVLEGRWPRTEVIGRDAKGLRLGLLGFGTIARQVAIRARAFGLGVWAADPFVGDADPAWAACQATRCELPEMLPRIDVLSIHVPLTDATRGLIDAKALASMPRGGYLINTARGGIVDEPALIEALRDGRLAGAALDVVAQEPLPAGSAFVGVPNLFMSPHVAGITTDANLRASLLTAENVRCVLEKRKPPVADAAAPR
ncbi:MAG: NAD(P)-dependent oxidoreductase [Lautropia sp.]